jgi:hypothetical protein
VLAEFEVRLVEVLGSRLPAPFAGRVSRAPDLPAGVGPAVQVAVQRIVPLDPDFGSTRLEQAPGAADRRRVVRLRCDVGVEVVPGPDSGRAQRVAGTDALLHLLGGADFRDGSALIEAGDPGFLLDSLRVVGGDLSPIPTDPAAEVAPPRPALQVMAEGWFWPVGVAGEVGRPLVEAQVRQVVLPVVLRPTLARLLTGGDPVALELGLGAVGTLEVHAEDTTSSPFGSIAVGLVSRAGGPGAGVLTGGTAGPGGRRILPVADGRATVTYAPPAAPATDQLVVSAFVVDSDGNTHVGLELARFPLRVESPA